MRFLLLDFFTGLSLIFAIGVQNIFVIEQGLKKHYVFLVCLICSLSALILIFLGLFFATSSIFTPPSALEIKAILKVYSRLFAVMIY